jgi:uncharacterized membrane protein YtjA (UPF0391 family)
VTAPQVLLRFAGAAWNGRASATFAFRLCSWSTTMLKWALIFAVIALIAGALGFAGIAGAAAGIAKILFFVFVLGFLIFLVLGFTVAKKVV